MILRVSDLRDKVLLKFDREKVDAVERRAALGAVEVADLALGAKALLEALQLALERLALVEARAVDQHQLPLARLEILLALAREGPAAGLAAASQTMDRFELGGSSPRYGWPVVTAAAFAVLAAARLAGLSHDERLRDEALAVADRLRTVAEKLETFGPAQRLDATRAHLLALGFFVDQREHTLVRAFPIARSPLDFTFHFAGDLTIPPDLDARRLRGGCRFMAVDNQDPSRAHSGQRRHRRDAARARPRGEEMSGQGTGEKVADGQRCET